MIEAAEQARRLPGDSTAPAARTDPTCGLAACQYLATHAAERTKRIADLRAVRVREMDSDQARAEAEGLLFGLRPA